MISLPSPHTPSPPAYFEGLGEGSEVGVRGCVL
jgi:hypothetical protein